LFVCLFGTKHTNFFWFAPPNSQPAPAYDLLVRFLTSKSLIDVPLPQVRSSHPFTPKTLDWMHLYPTGQTNYVDSFNDTPQPPATLEGDATVGATLGAVNFLQSRTSTMPADKYLGESSSSQHGGLFMAFVAGLVVAVVGMQILQGRRGSRRRTEGYASVPDSTLS
jgi:hypothetical protein